MKNPIKNLGDYASINDDLKLFDGSKEKLYQSIADTAVAKAAPKLLIKGGIIATALIGFSYAGCRGICTMKERRKKIESEPQLKKQFYDYVDSTEMVDEANIEMTE